jgi:hypothetical protein
LAKMEWRNTVKRCADEAAARKAGGEEMTKAQKEMLDLANSIRMGHARVVHLNENNDWAPYKHGLVVEALYLAAQSDAPGRSVEIGPITIATNDTGAHFFPATADSSASVPQEPNNEEMENYRMALAYISKQSTDQQSRELAETALNAFPADRVPQSPNVSEALAWLINCVECEVNIPRTTTVFQLRLAQAKEALALSSQLRPQGK